ncbi:MAG: SGNH/GDSL hydrolase family protein [Chthoniobacterales bacterium]
MILLMAALLKIITFGDSTTAPRKNVTVYTDLLAMQLAEKAILLNKGVPGNTTAMAKKRFERDVLAENPDIVVVQFGLNDSAVDVWKNPPADSPRVSPKEYEENLRYFINEIRKKGAQPVLMTPNQMRWSNSLRKLYNKPSYDLSDERGSMPLLTTYVEIVRKRAKELDVPLVDIFSLYDEWEKQTGEPVEALLSVLFHY